MADDTQNAEDALKDLARLEENMGQARSREAFEALSKPTESTEVQSHAETIAETHKSSPFWERTPEGFRLRNHFPSGGEHANRPQTLGKVWVTGAGVEMDLRPGPLTTWEARWLAGRLAEAAGLAEVLAAYGVPRG